MNFLDFYVASSYLILAVVAADYMAGEVDQLDGADRRDEIPEYIRKGLKFHPVERMEQVIEILFNVKPLPVEEQIKKKPTA